MPGALYAADCKAERDAEAELYWRGYYTAWDGIASPTRRKQKEHISIAGRPAPRPFAAGSPASAAGSGGTATKVTWPTRCWWTSARRRASPLPPGSGPKMPPSLGTPAGHGPQRKRPKIAAPAPSPPPSGHSGPGPLRETKILVINEQLFLYNLYNLQLFGTLYPSKVFG